MRSSNQKVLDFVPPKFELGTPGAAKQYIEDKKEKKTDFRMSDVIRVQTGVEQAEQNSFEQQVENRTLEKLKEVQETAYQEAYQLGFEEGKVEALKKKSTEITDRLDRFDTLLTSIEKLKLELVQQNESHLVQLAFHMASRIAHAEIKADPQATAAAIRSAVQTAQQEEEVTVQVAASQLDFLETLKKEMNREFEFMKKIKLVADPSVTEGGCIIETNYGVVDARVEERVSKLWETISESLFRVKNKITAAS